MRKRWERWAVTRYADGDVHETLVSQHWFRRTADWATSWSNWPLAMSMIAYTNHLVPPERMIVSFDVETRETAKEINT